LRAGRVTLSNRRYFQYAFPSGPDVGPGRISGSCEGTNSMKKVLALLVVALVALPVLVGAQMGDNAKMVQMFSSQTRTGWGSLQVVVLNDRTVEALFGASPAKAAFRTKARLTSMFFVQGTVNKDFELKPEVSVVQKGETIEGKVTPMKNFAAGKVAKGEMVQGLVEMSKKVDLFEPFKVNVGPDSVDFRLNAEE
jgi:hypothetical protein